MALAQPKTIPSLTQAQQAAALCLDLKAKDVLLLDLRRVSDATDFFLIASGTSDTHVRSIAGHVDGRAAEGRDPAASRRGARGRAAGCSWTTWTS